MFFNEGIFDYPRGCHGCDITECVNCYVNFKMEELLRTAAENNWDRYDFYYTNDDDKRDFLCKSLDLQLENGKYIHYQNGTLAIRYIPIIIEEIKNPYLFFCKQVDLFKELEENKINLEKKMIIDDLSDGSSYQNLYFKFDDKVFKRTEDERERFFIVEQNEKQLDGSIVYKTKGYNFMHKDEKWYRVQIEECCVSRRMLPNLLLNFLDDYLVSRKGISTLKKIFLQQEYEQLRSEIKYQTILLQKIKEEKRLQKEKQEEEKRLQKEEKRLQKEEKRQLLQKRQLQIDQERYMRVKQKNNEYYSKKTVLSKNNKQKKKKKPSMSNLGRTSREEDLEFLDNFIRENNLDSVKPKSPEKVKQKIPTTKTTSSLDFETMLSIYLNEEVVHKKILFKGEVLTKNNKFFDHKIL
jgi:hypothetical protein